MYHLAGAAATSALRSKIRSCSFSRPLASAPSPCAMLCAPIRRCRSTRASQIPNGVWVLDDCVGWGDYAHSAWDRLRSGEVVEDIGGEDAPSWQPQHILCARRAEHLRVQELGASHPACSPGIMSRPVIPQCHRRSHLYVPSLYVVLCSNTRFYLSLVASQHKQGVEAAQCRRCSWGFQLR